MFTINEEGLKAFPVSKEKWLRGEGTLDSKLLRPDDCMMCIFGHYLKAAGIDDDDLLDAKTPRQLPPDAREGEAVEWLIEYQDDDVDDSAEAEDIMKINDERGASDELRIEFLTEIFRAHGYLPVFVD